MQISDVRIRLVTREGMLRAVASITIDACFVVHDIKILEREGELFIGMPSRRTAEGEYKDIAHPINQETRNLLSEIILQHYKEALAGAPVGGQE